MVPTFALVFVLLYMSGPCIGYGPAPPDCRTLNKWDGNYDDITRVIFAQQYERITGRWRPYNCDVERVAREYFNATEPALKEISAPVGTSCKGFSHEREKEEPKPGEDYTQLNNFKLAMTGIRSWQKTDKTQVEDATTYGCHYNRNATTGRVVCVFCK
ncbi:hypothetical protein Y032_0003g1681 [Ancylostoma ceylanicum]|uniref:SCP domain-containing protein n=1 Tax=Ancylostoma ceylanicum TaxID=53326 RepID=A0A016W0U0_9BILA|nr:hypothetical protein Y032_0003g1681 [Ancylostoma ceylanicum]